MKKIYFKHYQRVYPESLRHNRDKFNQRAFSLYEFLIVFFIISLMAAITLPTISNLSPAWKISNNSNVILSKLRQAQEEAVTTQKPHAVIFSPAAIPPSFQLKNLDSGESETINLDANTTITLDPTITDNQIVFSSDGGPTGNGNIVVNFSSRTKTINISPAGVIKIVN